MIPAAAVSGDSTAIIVALLGGGFLSALVAALRFKPDKDAVVVTAAQGAAEILNGVIDALNEEIARRTKVEKALRAELAVVARERDDARDELAELRRLAGRRRADKQGDNDAEAKT